MQAGGLRDPLAVDPQIARRDLTSEASGKKFVLELARRGTQKPEVLAQRHQRIGRIQQPQRPIAPPRCRR